MAFSNVPHTFPYTVLQKKKSEQSHRHKMAISNPISENKKAGFGNSWEMFWGQKGAHKHLARIVRTWKRQTIDSIAMREKLGRPINIQNAEAISNRKSHIRVTLS